MKKTDEKKLITEVTNNLLTNKFQTEMGQKALVERSTIQNEHMDKLRGVIAEVGKNLEEVGAAPKGMTYVGSMSVHIYTSQILRAAAFVQLSELKLVDYNLADGAMREMRDGVLRYYGKATQRRRSGTS